MARIVAALLMGLAILPGSSANAADSPVANTWKFTFLIPTQMGRQPLSFLVLLSQSDKGWVGDFLGASQPLRQEPTFEKVNVKEDHLTFSMKFGGETISFDGRLTKDGKKINGSLNLGGGSFLVEMSPSKLKNLEDEVALAREVVETAEPGPDYFDALFLVLEKATTKKLKVEDVRAITDKAAKAAEKFGPRWQRHIALRSASILSEQEALGAVALEQARQAERMLAADDEVAIQMQVLQALADTLRKTKKTDELRPIETRLMKLEARDFAEFLKQNPIKVEEFKGRKGKSDRAALVELFTGSEAEACAAMELAFNALSNTFKPTDVVLLQYHVHFGGVDPLTIQDGITRLEQYAKKLDRVGPMICLNGKKDEAGPGPRNATKLRYTTYRESLEELLEAAPAAKLTATATQKGQDITINAKVDKLEKPGEKITLRIALVEDRVRYVGENGLRYHFSVVRGFAGGVKGTALTKATMEHTATINVDKVREEITKYLDELSKQARDFPAERAVTLKNLRIVAFIQDDTTNEILQATQVEIEEKKE